MPVHTDKKADTSQAFSSHEAKENPFDLCFLISFFPHTSPHGHDTKHISDHLVLFHGPSDFSDGGDLELHPFRLHLYHVPAVPWSPRHATLGASWWTASACLCLRGHRGWCSGCFFFLGDALEALEDPRGPRYCIAQDPIGKA